MPFLTVEACSLKSSDATVVLFIVNKSRSAVDQFRSAVLFNLCVKMLKDTAAYICYTK